MTEYVNALGVPAVQIEINRAYRQMPGKNIAEVQRMMDALIASARGLAERLSPAQLSPP